MASIFCFFKIYNDIRLNIYINLDKRPIYLFEMKSNKALNKERCIINILDLPEQIFRNIFRHISTQELFSTARKLNRDVKQ